MEQAERLALAVLFGVILLWATLGALPVGLALTLWDPTCFELTLTHTQTGASWGPTPHSHSSCDAELLCRAVDCSV